MATLILLDGQGAVVDRIALGPGRTVVGGASAERPLPGLATGELHIWADEHRLECAPGSAEVRVAGEHLRACALADGVEFEWAGFTLRYQVEALLDEVDASDDGSRAWRRLKAGLLVELGKADRRAAKRWQDAVVAGEFDPDRAADEILAATPVGDDEPAFLERSARLQRDLIMQPALRGVRGAARGVRRAGRNLVASLLVQSFVVLVLALVFGLGLLLARYQGFELDELLDRVLSVLPSRD